PTGIARPRTLIVPSLLTEAAGVNCLNTAKFVADKPGIVARVANPAAVGVTIPAAPAALPRCSRSYEVKKKSLLRNFQMLGPPSPTRGKKTGPPRLTPPRKKSLRGMKSGELEFRLTPAFFWIVSRAFR